ncbi:MAG TPA: AmmeMemoRadiSam system protein A [Terriglobales bacterium]|nr:AmmeMemoRadiSam system protein A [Terriglobales bacterium]
MSPQPENSPAAEAAEPQPYSAEERVELLRLAHEAIEAALAGRKLELNPVSERLLEPRGAFTTLHMEGNLRGCVGYVYPVKPLYRTVAETAAAAAFNDTRFLPVTAVEAPRLKVEISVLSPLVPIAAEDIEAGRHGLVVTLGSRRGLLLPQVAVEFNWDSRTFLQETCHKAGLPPDAWERGAIIEAFTAEVFHDEGFVAKQ